MKLVSTNVTIVKKSANALIKALRAARDENDGFTIHADNGRIIGYAEPIGPADHTVSIGERVVRIVPRNLVVQTVRLYADAQRLRRRLDVAEMMIVRPV
jgi:hypothetical protein